jgi:hypothetical protein
MPQLSTAELAQQGDAKAIAALLSQSLLPYEIDVDASLVDGCLFLHLISLQVMDQVKLMALVRAELDPLQIATITKVKVHGWRKDPVIHERRLFWTEQFVLGSSLRAAQQSGVSANLSSAQIQQEQEFFSDLTQNQSHNEIAADRANLADVHHALHRKVASQENNPNSSKSGTWQLLLLGLAIVTLGLAIGIVIRVFTAKSSVPIANNTPTASTTAAPAPIVTAEPIQPSEVKITLEKFNQIQKGMTLQEVQEIIGSPGKLIAESKLGDVSGQVYSWKNSQGSNAIIEFKNSKVVAKAQAGL